MVVRVAVQISGRDNESYTPTTTVPSSETRELIYEETYGQENTPVEFAYQRNICLDER